jgi:hypothetical protein
MRRTADRVRTQLAGRRTAPAGTSTGSPASPTTGPAVRYTVTLHTDGSPRFAADSAERYNTAAGSGQPQRRQIPTTHFRPSTVATGVLRTDMAMFGSLQHDESKQILHARSDVLSRDPRIERRR